MDSAVIACWLFVETKDRSPDGGGESELGVDAFEGCVLERVLQYSYY